MKLLLYPFFSQQNKLTGKFLLGSDSGVRHYSYIAAEATKLGWSTRMVLPQQRQIHDAFLPPCDVVRAPQLELCNLRRRVQWDPSWLLKASEGADVVLTQHEHAAIPLRALRPELKVAMECGLLPDIGFGRTRKLFHLAWEAADLVHCTNGTCQRETAFFAPSEVWEFGYDEREQRVLCAKTVDVLFNARSSATNYSNHLDFIAAVRDSGLRVAMTDPTSYLRRVDLGQFVMPAESREEYLSLLQRSRVVVSLLPAGTSAYGFREAVHHGCVPVCYKHRDNVDLLGESWPHYIQGDILATVRGALGGVVPPIACSFAKAWQRARHSLEALCS